MGSAPGFKCFFLPFSLTAPKRKSLFSICPLPLAGTVRSLNCANIDLHAKSILAVFELLIITINYLLRVNNADAVPSHNLNIWKHHKAENFSLKF